VTFADEIRGFRDFLSWTQSELAETIPITTRTVQRWERGVSKKPVTPVLEQRIRELMQQHGYQRRD
jgi:DNA-binding transcriptional regulator YiaG